MRIVGFIAVAIVAIGVLIALVVLVRSIPDIRRYSRIRKM